MRDTPFPLEIAAIVARLDDADPRRRIVAAETLSSLRGDASEAIEAMVERSILDPIPRVRYALLAANELIGVDQSEWRRLYARLLSHGDEIVVARAAWAIGRIGPAASDAVPDLLAVALDSRRIVDPRWSAVAALGRLGRTASSAGPGLVGLLRDDPDPDMREAAARALGTTRDDANAVSALVTALDDPDHLVRESAAEGLQSIGRPLAAGSVALLAQLLGDSWPTVRRATVRALSVLEPGRTWSEVPVAPNSEHRDVVAHRLSEFLEGVRSDDERRRQISVFEIGKLGPEAAAAVPLLADLYGIDENLDIRWSAAWACGKMEEHALEAVPALMRGLEHDLDPDVRAQTAWALGRLGSICSAWSAAIVDSLTRSLSDPDSLVREEAILAVGAIAPGDPRVLEEMGHRLADSHPLVRQRAAQVLHARRLT